MSVLQSTRTQRLAQWNAIYDCSRYDDRQYSWDGSYVGQNTSWLTAVSPMLSSIETPGFVPLSARRPSNPYRLGKMIVDKFTSFVFQGQIPTLQCIGDQDTEDFAKAIVKEGSFGTKLMRARTIGGACGTVGLSWAIKKGKPRLRVHNGQHLYVHAWDDRDELIPRHVTELYRFQAVAWNEEKGRAEEQWFWHRRDWTDVADVVYDRVLYEQGKEPDWNAYLNPEKSFIHDDGFCHFAWIQNRPCENEDGLPDYYGVEEQLSEIDVLNSLMSRALRMNLDPTLVLKMDGDYVKRVGVKKGSDNALVVGKDGEASYLEMTGQSITVGLDKLQKDTVHILDVVQCVLHDPNEIAAQGLSGAAIRLILAPMIDAGQTFQEQYGNGFKRVMEQIIDVGRALAGTSVQVPSGESDEEGNPAVDPETGEPKTIEAQQGLDLPPKEIEEDETDEKGLPTGEKTTKLQDHSPGDGQWFEVEWPEMVGDTVADKTALITALSTACAGQQIVSQQTAVEVVAKSLDKDPDDEWRKVSVASQQQKEEQQQQMQQQLDAAGGAVGKPGDMPPGAQSKKPPFGGGGGKPGGGGSPKPPGGGGAPPFGGGAGKGGQDEI